MSTIEPDRPSAGTLEIAVFNRTRSWAVEVQDDVGARRIILTRARVVVGSSSAADIVTADATVSGKHLALSVAPGGVLIQDLGSKNGTFVGGARVTEARGDTGTTVLLGRSTLTLRGMGPEEEADEEAEPLDGVAGGSLVMRRIAARVGALRPMRSRCWSPGRRGPEKSSSPVRFTPRDPGRRRRSWR